MHFILKCYTVLSYKAMTNHSILWQFSYISGTAFVQYSPLWDSDLYIHAGTLVKDITENPRYNDSIFPQDFAVKKNLPLYRIPTCTSNINDKKLFITEDPRYNDSICPQNFAVKKILPLCRIPTCTSIINDKKPFPLIYSKKQMLWIFVRIASARRF